MWLIKTNFIIPKGFSGITLYPFVFAHKRTTFNNVFINHEKIHLRQQLELLIVPFFVWYFFEFLFRLIQFKNKKTAYRNISFEKEAYANEKNENYLKNRKMYTFLRYL
ncbi:hypothetical protein P3875_03005 [Myroides sp. JBRI-B21084]|uniref:hypothetical protein n=1 Tax=Myroides sp. JBRI-B21084 TaxID=3119977 RepID=UPI0026E37B2F|nr:hypothetical protein [Paenimyroides cloacae]WKW47044.1 hypothetical protein P3875_03005 [Paenimyroides cloacae]